MCVRIEGGNDYDYETVYDISDDEYQEYLNGRKDEIRKAVFEKSAATRANKYCAVFDVVRNIANIVRINRLGLNDGQQIKYLIKRRGDLNGN